MQVLVARAPVLELLSLHRRCNPKEVIVGWYSTATGDALVDDPTTVLVRRACPLEMTIIPSS